MTSLLCDLFCACSIIGIWPRYIEPNLLSIKKIELDFPLKRACKIAVFSDLHMHPGMSGKVLKKIYREITKEKPDAILFLGDFLCDSKLDDKIRLADFLGKIGKLAPSYAILGNHDYEKGVSVSDLGHYDVAIDESPYVKGVKRLFRKTTLTGSITEEAKRVSFHPKLMEVIGESPFSLLHNESIVINLQGLPLNLTGLGDYMLGKAKPEEAYRYYDDRYPGIALVHNPDFAPRLDKYPGQIILCGHTHGGQINLPWINRKLILMENPHYREGLFSRGKKSLYITRGVGSVIPFRWNAPPELTFITLRP